MEARDLSEVGGDVLLLFIITARVREGDVLYRWRRWRQKGKLLQILSKFTVWFGDVGPFGGNGEEGVRGTHRFTHKYYREEITEDRRRGL